MSGAQQAQRAQQAPTAGAQEAPRGMRRIPIPLESYQHSSAPINQKRLVNMYAEPQPDDSRSPVALLPTPGLSQLSTMVFGAGPIEALNTDRPGITYGVSGTHFYRADLPVISGPLVITDLGDIGTITLPDFANNLMITIAGGINSIVVCVPPKAYTATDGGALSEITGTFPGASSVAYLHGYHIWTASTGDSKWFVTNLLDPTVSSALDFAYADAVPNHLRRICVLRDELWLFGDKAIEIWYDSGDGDFPFRRRSGGLINGGCYSIRTIAQVDNSLFWMGAEGHILRSVGYKAQIISTPAIEQALRGPGLAGTGIYAFAYEQEGHSFYVLTIGTRTVVYDCATKAWHERATGTVDSAWFCTCGAPNPLAPLFGTSTSGRILIPSLSGATEDGAAVPRLVQLPPLWAGTRRGFVGRLEIEADVGLADDAPSVLLQWSDNGGRNWTAGRTLTINQAGNYRQRLVATRLGSFRERMFRLVFASGRTTVFGVDADIDYSAH